MQLEVFLSDEGILPDITATWRCQLPGFGTPGAGQGYSQATGHDKKTKSGFPDQTTQIFQSKPLKLIIFRILPHIDFPENIPDKKQSKYDRAKIDKKSPPLSQGTFFNALHLSEHERKTAWAE